MKTLAGSVAVGHIAQLEDELSQARAERDEARAQVKKLEAECNKVCRSIRVMEPAYRETVDCMIANGAGWAAARRERNEARRHACRLMWERDEARADAADLKFLLGGTCEMAVAPYDPHEVATIGYEVEERGHD